MLTVWNTEPEFFWLTNSIETLMSNILWMPCTSATIAFDYLKRFHLYADLTGASKEAIPFQAHDFSMRGMSSIEAATASAAAHLLSFLGTDTVPALDFLEDYYGATDPIGLSVPASEHSVQCLNAINDTGEVDDRLYLRRMLDQYPTGIVSIVCDGFDFWKFVTEVLPEFKDEIMARDGKVVIRPDSGIPENIICGEPNCVFQDGQWYRNLDTIADIHKREIKLERIDECVAKGAVECLWDIFGS